MKGKIYILEYDDDMTEDETVYPANPQGYEELDIAIITKDTDMKALPKHMTSYVSMIEGLNKDLDKA